MRKNLKRSLAAFMTIVTVVGVSCTGIVSAAAEDIPPADRIVDKVIEKDLTVPNGMNVKLVDEKGQLMDGSFELKDQSGNVVYTWSGNQGYEMVSPPVGLERPCQFDEKGVSIRLKDVMDTGDIEADLDNIYNQGWAYGEYGYGEDYAPYGNKMSGNVETVTIPAGQVWISVDEGYKRQTPAQQKIHQSIELDGVAYDLSDLAGKDKKLDLGANDYGCRCTVRIDNSRPSVVESGYVYASDKDEEYVRLTLDWHKYYPQRVNAEGKCENNGVAYSYGAGGLDGDKAAVAYMQIKSGAVINYVAFDEGNPTATIYLKKGDYSPKILTATEHEDLAKDGSAEIEYGELYDFAKHVLTLAAPPTEGMNLGYIPAGTYTLHQTETAKGYELAEDRTITIKDSCQASDFQKIVVTNEPIGAHKHTFSDQWTSDGTSHWHAATCEHSSLAMDKAAHTYGDWKVVKEPTTEATGLQERRCTVCGYAEQEVLPVVAPVQPDQPDNPTEPTKPATPETGDQSHVWLWSAALIASCGGLALVRKKRAK